MGKLWFGDTEEEIDKDQKEYAEQLEFKVPPAGTIEHIIFQLYDIEKLLLRLLSEKDSDKRGNDSKKNGNA